MKFNWLNWFNKGQQAVCEKVHLPREINHGNWKELESFGVRRIGNVDHLLIEAKLPSGWKKVATEHPMWSKLVDDKGRLRANIFYKTEFYDRRAHMSLCTRYELNHIYSDEDQLYYVQVLDCDNVLYQTKAIAQPSPDADREIHLEYFDNKDLLWEEAKAWLKAQFPRYENCSAYWK